MPSRLSSTAIRCNRLGLLEGLDVEYAAAAPFADQPFDGKFRLVGSRDGAASALLDQLADLFVERHAFDQFRGAPPVLRGDGCARRDTARGPPIR